ncbi:MAG TPA: D-alanine--D-alanine ligase [Caldithrix abyssi]|uniref:D-alanine--D-alanine ligase n=1 Tax=Caldithrix abyssi TaxID=187145 RepID=A0A7V5PQ36_CALAY|nr:D-alanine--D-alanine ligase [Caldithrix abyssi]
MKIVVLMGGDSTEREVSLVTGDQIVRALTENGHQVIKIDPTATKKEQTELNQTDRHWIGIDYPDIDLLPLHRGSLYLKNILITKRLKPDLVFNALHGGKGENGVVQGMLDAAEIPYTGSGRIASMLAMQKDLSKLFFRNANLPTPRAHVLDRPQASRKKLKKINFPQVVKPNDQGSTIGLSIVHGAEELDEAIDRAFELSSKVIVEEYIPGREITVAILKQRALPIVEILPEHGLYDYECKYKHGMSRYEVPAKLDKTLAQEIQKISLKAHQILGCKGYSRVDLRLSDDGQPYILEVNTLPGMTGTSLVPKAAKAAGLTFNDLVEAIVEEAIKK